jgi:hypothetical protein
MSDYNISLEETSQIIKGQIAAHEQCLKLNQQKQEKELMNPSVAKKIEELEENIKFYQEALQKIYALSSPNIQINPNSTSAA